jgi:hypothetical protein
VAEATVVAKVALTVLLEPGVQGEG